MQAELVALAEELDMLVAGPNGQGVVSTPAHLCAQIVAPYPPAGRIGIASQSGNFVSSFLNYAVQTGVGVSRAVSAGNAAAVSIPDFLEYYAADAATDVALGYVEGVQDGRAFFERARAVASTMPLVLVKGGATAGGQRAAASHTGSLASDDRVFDGMCRQAGITRAATIESAYEAAATFATQPLPRGQPRRRADDRGRVGRGHRRRHQPQLARPDAAARRPAGRARRASSRPAGAATTRSTSPAPRPATPSPRSSTSSSATPTWTRCIYLGLGIQSNQAHLMRNGPFYPDHGLERIVDYHERQDARFAEAAAEASTRYDKPVLTATELAVTHPNNAGPVAVRASGPALLPVGQPRRRGPRPAVGLRPPPPGPPHGMTGHSAPAHVPPGHGAAAHGAAALARLRERVPRPSCATAWPAIGELGVVLIDRGSEVGGGEVRTDIGTVARILDAQELPDGRWAVVCVGDRRIRVTRWLDDDPYPRAEVEDWPDPPPAATTMRPSPPRSVGCGAVLALAAEAGDDAGPATAELSEDPTAGRVPGRHPRPARPP